MFPRELACPLGYLEVAAEVFTVRRRWVYTSGGQPLAEPYEVSDDWRNAELRAPVATEELVYGALRGPDGEDLSSRKKHRDFMKANNLALHGDMKSTWERINKERAKARSGKDPERIEKTRQTMLRINTKLRY